MPTLSKSLMLTPKWVDKAFEWEPARKDPFFKSLGKNVVVFTICTVVIPIFALFSLALQSTALICKTPLFVISFLYCACIEVSDELKIKEMKAHVEIISCLAISILISILLIPTTLSTPNPLRSIYVTLGLSSLERKKEFNKLKSADQNKIKIPLQAPVVLMKSDQNSPLDEEQPGSAKPLCFSENPLFDQEKISSAKVVKIAPSAASYQEPKMATPPLKLNRGPVEHLSASVLPPANKEQLASPPSPPTSVQIRASVFGVKLTHVPFPKSSKEFF